MTSSRLPDTHAEAWALLPWLANGRINADDREWVEAHAHACADCRAELERQRTIAAQMSRDGSTAPASAVSDEQRSFNKLWSRIEAAESAALPAAEPIIGTGIRSGSSRTVRWLAAAVVVQAIGLGVFGVVTLRAGSQGNEFQTVTSTPAVRTHAPAVRIVFSPDTSIETMNTLLEHQGLEIVAGPGRAGNFTAVLSADAVASGASAESVAAVIAKDPHVDFAQPVAR